VSNNVDGNMDEILHVTMIQSFGQFMFSLICSFWVFKKFLQTSCFRLGRKIELSLVLNLEIGGIKIHKGMKIRVK